MQIRQRRSGFFKRNKALILKNCRLFNKVVANKDSYCATEQYMQIPADTRFASIFLLL